MANIAPIESPTEVDHYQLRRVIDVYVAPKSEDLGKLSSSIDDIVAQTKLPEGVRVDLRGSVQGMRSSFKSFGFGLLLSVALVYLIFVAQFESFLDPFIILFAIPPGLAGVLFMLLFTGTTLNIMSLMGLVMMVGIVVSNSILIVDFSRSLWREGKPLKEAVAVASRIRLRPVLMTSLATVIGLIPMALKLGTGAEAYAPLARAIIGGLLLSVVVTVYLVPAAYLWVHQKEELRATRSASVRRNILLLLSVPLLSLCSHAQASFNIQKPGLPSAPMPQAATSITILNTSPIGQQSSPSQANPTNRMALSLKEAEARALKNNPQISVARLTALALQQVTREVRSNLWPTAEANLTGVDSRENSRITAGGLNNPIIYQRAAAGATVSQLITDFGRTANLVSSATLAAKAEDQNAIATKEQILLAVDQAFYGALQAHAVLKVAQQTVSARQAVADQVEALFKSKLKSQLDFSFANVNLAQAKLLLLDAENNQSAALANLSVVLGLFYAARLSAGGGRDTDCFASGQCGRSYFRGARGAPGDISARLSVPIGAEVSQCGTRLVLTDNPSRRSGRRHASAQPSSFELVRCGGRER